MIPHLKGLSICRLDVDLKEHFVLCVLDAKNAVLAEKKQERTVRSCTFHERPTEIDEWDLRGIIEVPNTLERCTQDCDGNFIKVKHRYAPLAQSD
jgi:arrestin-related trafficking adapter 4/5/7